jgi:hypothetical protein
VLAGREPILDDFTTVRRKVDELGEGDRGWILHGLRGVGKTVLLNELLAQVSSKGWIAAKVEAAPASPAAGCPGLSTGSLDADRDRPAPRAAPAAVAGRVQGLLAAL